MKEVLFLETRFLRKRIWKKLKILKTLEILEKDSRVPICIVWIFKLKQISFHLKLKKKNKNKISKVKKYAFSCYNPISVNILIQFG